VSARGLKVWFRLPRRAPVDGGARVVDGIDLDIMKGDSRTRGESGCGKSTRSDADPAAGSYRRISKFQRRDITKVRASQSAAARDAMIFRIPTRLRSWPDCGDIVGEPTTHLRSGREGNGRD
jgi:ABC-type dipeptide/oligopeptide/nickel transport system ATPase component